MQKEHKRINIVLPGLGDSGGIKVIYIYKRLLEQNGWDVEIYSSIIQNNLHRYSCGVKNIVHRIYCTIKASIEVNRKNDIKWVPLISDNTIRNADVTIATMWATAYDVAKLNPSKGIKYYFVQDFEVWDNKLWGLNSYKLPLKKIVISTWINEQLMKELKIGPFPVVMNGIDTNIYSDRNIRDDSTKIFLMLNHTLEKKGVKYGIQVFEKVRELYPDAKLKMFGMCDSNNLPEYVEYHQNPSCDELINLYCTSNYFLFPSLEEGWGLTPLEAMACGCVVVGTKTGFVLDVGEHEKNMMISKPGDLEEMIKNTLRIMTDDKLRERLCCGMRYTIKKLNWECSIKRFEELLNKHL